MGISDKTDQNNLVQIIMKGRNYPTAEHINNNTFWVHKSQAIRYILTELRQIKCKVDHDDKYKILKGYTCHIIRKIHLNRRSTRCGQSNK